MTDPRESATPQIERYLDQCITDMLEKFEKFPKADETRESVVRAAARAARHEPIPARTRVSVRPKSQKIHAQVNLLLVEPPTGDTYHYVPPGSEALAAALAAAFVDPVSPETTSASHHEHLYFYTGFPPSVDTGEVREWIRRTNTAIRELVDLANVAFEQHNLEVDKLETEQFAAMKRAEELNTEIGGPIEEALA
jgi:hypothetical protein